MAIFVLVILLIIFFALKPSSDTVESFTQSNSNEIPVQFQSLDQSQLVETTILDNPPAQNQMPNEMAAASVMPMQAAQAEQPQMQPAQTQAEQPKPTVPVQPMKNGRATS